MSKGLEALKHLYLTATARTNALCVMDYETIQKELKALEIIKEKQVDVSCLLFDGLDAYNENMHPSRVISKEEYDLLKEVLL